MLTCALLCQVIVSGWLFSPRQYQFPFSSHFLNYKVCLCIASNLIFTATFRGRWTFYRCRSWGRVARSLSCGHVSSMWFKFQLWPESSASYFIFLLLPTHLQSTLLMVLAMTCKTLHTIWLLPASLNSLHKLPHWGRHPAALGNSILFFKNSHPFLPLNHHMCSLCLDCHLRAVPSHVSLGHLCREDLSYHPNLKGPPLPLLLVIYFFFLELLS